MTPREPQQRPFPRWTHPVLRCVIAWAGVTVVAGGCAESAIEQPDDAELPGFGGGTPDAGSDAGDGGSGGSVEDSGAFDAALPGADAGSSDGAGDGVPKDAGSKDAGTDAGPMDAGTDAGPMDAGADAGPKDAGVDAGPKDAGVDAGPKDAGVDAGPKDAGSVQCQTADDCTNDCIPLGILRCCESNRCGCTWAPGAYCTL